MAKTVRKKTTTRPTNREGIILLAKVIHDLALASPATAVERCSVYFTLFMGELLMSARNGHLAMLERVHEALGKPSPIQEP